MKSQNSPISGIILIVSGLIFAGFVVGISFVFANFAGNNSHFPTFMIFIPAAFMGLIGLGFVGFGIWMVVRGRKSAKIKENGHKSTCEIFNILRVKNGYTMIVTYQGDSGTTYKHSLPISYQAAASFKAGMIVECYVQGEDCYVDGSHLVEVDDRY